MAFKTQALGIIGVGYQGGLLERFSSPKPILPGTVIMVPENVWCVLVAGDQATKVFGGGPHELDLMMFNRQPSGQIYVVPSRPKKQVGVTVRGDLERHLEVQITDPLKFASYYVLQNSMEDDHELWKSLFQMVDSALIHTEYPHIRQTLDDLLGQKLMEWGITITDFFEQPVQGASFEKKTLRIRKTPFSPPGGSAAVSGEGVENNGALNKKPNHRLKITSVWATSTMDLFGKGELTLQVRVTAAHDHDTLQAGDYIYDRVLRYESPNGWLQAKKWQTLPEDVLTFDGLDPSWNVHVHVLAEERDTSSVDALGEVCCEVPKDSEFFEIGPTEGGKRNNYVNLKASFSEVSEV